MPIAEARVATQNGSKYVAQLCKHFRHKVPAEFDERSGQVDFQPGQCTLKVEEGALLVRCESEDEMAMGRMKFILEDHLKRFAWREKPEIDWTTVA